MNLRKIEASSYREALAKVRAIYGDDALIVGTRTLQRGGVLGLGGKQVVEVYVTDTKNRLERLNAARAGVGAAAHEVPAAAPAPEPPRFSEPPRVHETPYGYEPPAAAPRDRSFGGPPAPSAPDMGVRLGEISETLEVLRGEVQRLLRRSEGPPWGHTVVEEAYALLRDRDIEEFIARDIIAGLDRQVLPEGSLGNGELRGLVSAHVANFIEKSCGRARPPETRVRILVGPTGVGKTTSIAKLAARERYARGRRVALVTLDTFRIAAVDQLRKYADIIGLELRVATDPPGLREQLESLSECDIVFVDSAGRSPADEMRVGELESFVRSVPEAEVSLVVSATSGVRTLKQAIERFKRVGFGDLIVTKLDESLSPGVILSALAEARCPVSYVTNGQNVPDDIEPVDPQRLADLILEGG